MTPFKQLVLAVLLFTSTHLIAQTTPLADQVIKDACTEAAKTHKKVLIIFHASWCGWCHKMDTVIARPACQPLFARQYVIRHLTILESRDKKDQENPGAAELYAKYGGNNEGIPFWL